MWPHGLQHSRHPCPSPSPVACSNSCPLSQWCYPTISSSATLFSLCLQSFPSIRVFSNELALRIRWMHTGASVSTWVFLMNIQGWFPSGLTGLISLLFKSLLQHYSLKASVLWCSAFLKSNSHPHITTGKTTALTRQTFVSKVMSLLFGTLPRFAVAVLPRSKCLLISWLQSSSAVTLEVRKIKFVTASTLSPSICHGVIGLDATILVFLNIEFQASFSTLLLVI